MLDPFDWQEVVLQLRYSVAEMKLIQIELQKHRLMWVFAVHCSVSISSRVLNLSFAPRLLLWSYQKWVVPSICDGFKGRSSPTTEIIKRPTVYWCKLEPLLVANKIFCFWIIYFHWPVIIHVFSSTKYGPVAAMKHLSIMVKSASFKLRSEAVRRNRHRGSYCVFDPHYRSPPTSRKFRLAAHFLAHNPPLSIGHI